MRGFVRVGDRERIFLACALLPTLLFAADARAGDVPPTAQAVAAPASAITFLRRDRRESLERFAARHRLEGGEITSRYGATGIIRCGNAVGTAQLVLAADVIATAAHNLFNQDGRLRGDAEHCRFEIVVRGERQIAALDLARVVSGSTSPYGRPAIADWAVGPLVRPIIGAKPYPLAARITVPAAIVLFAAARPDGRAADAIEGCSARHITNATPSGLRELAVDCNGEGGTSGAAFLTTDGRFAGIYVGFRSRAPHLTAAFSDHHYNFGVTAEGDFRRALITAAQASPEYTAGTR